MRAALICKSCSKIVEHGDPKLPVRFTICPNCITDHREPIRGVIARIIPERFAKHRPAHDLFFCPFHHDTGNPNLVVYEHVCTCTAGCAINGKQHGDVYDFVQEYFHLPTFQAAFEYLAGSFDPIVPERQFAPKDKGRPITLEDVEKFHKDARLALPWFQSRFITPFTVDEKRLGVALSYGHSHTFRDGPMKGRTVGNSVRRYSVPNIAFGKVWYCKLRRDDGDAYERLSMTEAEIIQAVREERAARLTAVHGTTYRPEDVEDEYVIDALFGGRYTQLANPRHSKAVFNAERLLTKQGDDYVPVDLPYILIHEGEFKAMAMEDAGDSAHGYPSVSNKDNAKIAHLVSKCKRVLYVQDNGDTAGENFANHHRQWIPNLEVITAPDGLKAADDVIGAGIVHQWMASYGLEPIKLERHL